MIALRGFYAVLDRDDEPLARSLARAACALQLRIKPGEASELVRVARMARRVCDEAGIPLVVNDRVDVALAAGADGVHLGQSDLPVEAARALAGTRLFVGVSTHDVPQVERAVASGADYLGFGPIFATTTKQNPDPVQGLAGLRAAVAAARGTPVVAIGGITPDRARDIYAAGASCLCAIAAVNRASDIAGVAQYLRDVAR
ncbi:MAG: thiamine phosphate synthase [Acidobacteriota bacterium]